MGQHCVRVGLTDFKGDINLVLNGIKDISQKYKDG